MKHEDKLALVFLALLALQFGMQPILNKRYLPQDAHKTSIVLVGEAIKFGVSLLMLKLQSPRGAFQGWTLKSSFMAAGAPAFIYAFQNLLILGSYDYLDGLTINLINQSKTIFTAIGIYLLLGKKQSSVQCLALALMLGASVLLSQQTANTSDARAVSQADWLYRGIVPVFIASMGSGLASSLSQLSLQKAKRNSLVFSMELAAYSTLTLLLTLGTTRYAQLTAMRETGFFYGWQASTLIPIATNSCGGIVVGLVMKYAGGVRKGFAILGGILLTGIIDFLLEGNPLSMEKMVALPLVLLSTYLHMSHPYVGKDKKDK